MTNDLGIRLYAAALDVPAEEVAAFIVRYRTHARNNIISRLSLAAQAIVAEREAAARKEARREIYNAICAQWMDDATRLDRGIGICRDLVGKIIEGESGE